MRARGALLIALLAVAWAACAAGEGARGPTPIDAALKPRKGEVAQAEQPPAAPKEDEAESLAASVTSEEGDRSVSQEGAEGEGDRPRGGSPRQSLKDEGARQEGDDATSGGREPRREASPADCTPEARELLGSHLGPVFRVRQACSRFLRSYERGDCTKECNHAARILFEAAERNASVAGCVAADKEYEAMRKGLTEAKCGLSSLVPRDGEPHLDEVFNADGEAVTFSGVPGDDVLPGVSLAHARRPEGAESDAVPSVWKEQEYQAEVERAEQEYQAGVRARLELDMQLHPCKYDVANTCNRTTTRCREVKRECAAGVDAAACPQYQCMPLHPCEHNPCDRAKEVCVPQTHVRCVLAPCPTHACVPRQNFSGTVDSEGREVRDVNHTLLFGKPEPDELGLTPAERSACTGRFGPLARLQDACDVFAEQEVADRPSECPEACADGLAHLKSMIDTSPATARCARLPGVARYLRRLASTPCDPANVGLMDAAYPWSVPGVASDPIESTARNPAEYMGGADMAVFASDYMGEYMAPPPPPVVVVPPHAGNATGNDTDGGEESGDEGEGEEAPGIEVGGGGHEAVGGAAGELSTGLSPNGLEGTVHDPEAPAGPHATAPVVDKHGFCTGENDMLQLGPDGKPLYCVPRPPSVRVDNRGAPLYDAGSVHLHFPKRVEWDGKGHVVYPAPESASAHTGGADAAGGEDDDVTFDVVKHEPPAPPAKGVEEGDENGETTVPGLPLSSLPACAADGSCAAADTFCSAGSGRCLRHGVCTADADCSAPANTWIHASCVGTASCVEFSCQWECSAAKGKQQQEKEAEAEAEAEAQEAASKKGGGSADVSQFRTLFAHKLETLRQAGYKDEDRNLRMLIHFRGDINQVIAYYDGKIGEVDEDDKLNQQTLEKAAGKGEPVEKEPAGGGSKGGKGGEELPSNAKGAKGGEEGQKEEGQAQQAQQEESAAEEPPAQAFEGTPVDILETGFQPNA